LDEKIKRSFTTNTLGCVLLGKTSVHRRNLIILVTDCFNATLVIHWLDPAKIFGLPELGDLESNSTISRSNHFNSARRQGCCLLLCQQLDFSCLRAARYDSLGSNNSCSCSCHGARTAIDTCSHSKLKLTTLGIIRIFKTLGGKSRFCTTRASGIRQVGVMVNCKPGVDINRRAELNLVRVVIVALLSQVNLLVFLLHTEESVEPKGLLLNTLFEPAQESQNSTIRLCFHAS
jgi:hypothetical protein